MAMSDSILAAKFTALPLTEDEAEAAAGWADAFDVYFQDAEAGAGGSVIPAGLSACKAAMGGAMGGLSVTGAVAIQAGIVAYWGAILPTAWATCTEVTPPPGLSGLSVALIPVFLANTTGELSQADSMAAIAAAIHVINIVGGIAVFPPPPSGLGPLPIT